MNLNPLRMLDKVMNVSSKVMNYKKRYVMEDAKRREEADSVIRNHIIWSMGMGAIPIPFADFFAVSAVQLDMVRQLSRLYGIDFKETEGKALITSLTGSGLARLGAQAAIKLIPGVGSIVGGITMSVLSGASSYAIGEVFKEHFETGGTFLDFDPVRLKKYYQEKFEKGKTVAKDLKKKEEERKKAEKEAEATAKQEEEPTPKTEPIVETPAANTNSKNATFEKLKELAQLKEMGVLTEEEFAQMKAKIISKF